MKKIIAVLFSLLCIPAAAQNYLRDDGTFHSVVEGTTAGQVLINSGGLLAGTDVFNGGISPDGRGSPACVRGGVVDCTSGVVAAAAAANAAGVSLRLLVGGGYCIRPIQFGGSSPPSGMTLAALPYGISTESAKAAFVSCSGAATGTAMVRIVNYSAGNTINQNFTMGPLLIDAGANNSYALEIYGSVFSNIIATLRGASVASFYVNADIDHVIINNSWNISFDIQTRGISALMQTTDGAANGIAIAANRCVISNPFGTVAGDVVKTDYMNDDCYVDAESSGTGYGINLGHMASGDWVVHTEGNALGGVNGTVNSKGARVYGSSQDGVSTTLLSCITCVIDVWNLLTTTQERNLGNAISQSIYVKGLPATTTSSSGQGWAGAGSTNGFAAAGNGSANDFVVLNSTASVGCGLPHNTAIWNCSGYQINGAAPLNHIMLGDGTAYRDSATLPVAALPALTVDTNFQLTQGAALNLTAGSTVYAGLAGACAAEANCQVYVSKGGTIKNFYASGQAAPGGSDTFTLTLMTGARGATSASTVTCTITGVANSCSDLTHTIAVTAGQVVDVKMVASATAATTTQMTFTMTLTTTTP